MKRMIDERLPFELLSNEWDKVKSNGRLENVGFPMLILLRKNQVFIQDKILEI